MACPGAILPPFCEWARPNRSEQRQETKLYADDLDGWRKFAVNECSSIPFGIAHFDPSDFIVAIHKFGKASRRDICDFEYGKAMR